MHKYIYHKTMNDIETIINDTLTGIYYDKPVITNNPTTLRRSNWIIYRRISATRKDWTRLQSKNESLLVFSISILHDVAFDLCHSALSLLLYLTIKGSHSTWIKLLACSYTYLTNLRIYLFLYQKLLPLFHVLSN